MNIDDLKCTKIYVPKIEDRASVQLKLFDLGVRWRGSGNKIVKWLSAPFLFIDDNLNLAFGAKDQWEKFILIDYKQIKPSDIPSINEPSDELLDKLKRSVKEDLLNSVFANQETIDSCRVLRSDNYEVYVVGRYISVNIIENSTKSAEVVFYDDKELISKFNG